MRRRPPSLNVHMKNKTIASWLAFLGGPLGLHRFYLNGSRDWLGWSLPILSALGFYGVLRVRAFGVDDRWSWLLLPVLGLSIAGCALTAIVYGLMTAQKWNGKFNRLESADNPAGGTNWFTIAAVVFSLLVGAAALIAAIAFSFQRFFEFHA